MQTTTAEVTLAAQPTQVYAEVRALASRLWCVVDDDVLHAVPGEQLFHRVRLDGDTSCWLDWRLATSGARDTVVRLVQDEAHPRPGPAPDLDAVLDLLRASVEREHRPAAPPRAGPAGEA